MPVAGTRPDLQPQLDLSELSDETQLYTQFGSGIIRVFTLGQLKQFLINEGGFFSLPETPYTDDDAASAAGVAIKAPYVIGPGNPQGISEGLVKVRTI